MIVNPIFLRIVPERKPLRECGCQDVALINSCDVAPPGCFSSSRIISVLLPSRTPFSLAAFPGRAPLAFFAPLGSFLAWLAFLPRLGLARRDVARAFRDVGLFRGLRLVARRCGLGGFGFFYSRDHFAFFFGGDYRHDIDHSGALETQVKSERNRKRRWNGDGTSPMSPDVT